MFRMSWSSNSPTRPYRTLTEATDERTYFRMNKRTAIKKTGNGAMIPVTRDELRAMGAEVGTEVEVSVTDGRMTVAKTDSNYERTRAMAKKMRARYAHTLKLFGQ